MEISISTTERASRQIVQASSLYVRSSPPEMSSADNLQFQTSNRHLKVFQKGHWTPSQPLSSITILGVQEKPRQVLFGKYLSGAWEQMVSGQVVFGQHMLDLWEWDRKTQVLKIKGLETATKEGIWTRDWEMFWE